MEIFTVTGHSLLSPGYTNILTWQALGSSDTLPKFTSDEKVNIQEVKDLRMISLAMSLTREYIRMYRIYLGSLL